jgi:hypothetical protein
VIEKKVLRRIFRPMRDEVTNSNDQVNEDEIGRECSMNGEMRNAYGYWWGKPERMRPLRRPKRRWVDNTKMYLRDRMGWYGMD